MKLLPTAAIAGAVTLLSIQGASACGGCGCTAKKGAPPPASAIKTAAHGYKVVDIKAVEAAVNEKAIIVDARGGKFLDERRIPGAKALSAGSTPEQIAAALPDKNAKVVAYCTNLKCPASQMLAAKLVKLGYTNVEKYPEGIDGWEAAGKTVEKVAK